MRHILAAAIALLTALGGLEPAGAIVLRECSGRSLCLNGDIQDGDAKRFADFTAGYPAGTIIYLSGPGGLVVEALDIGDIIQKLGFITAVSRNIGSCASACALLFLSGSHAIIQRNSLLLFHEVASPEGEGASPEVYNYFANRIAAWGVTKKQALALLHAAPHETARPGTEWWARQLGFQYQVVPNFLWLWRTCPIKFCVAVP